jgi:outer membrane protein TolC
VVGLHATSQVREAYGAYRTTYDLARHYRDEIVPLRKTIADEMLLKYNGMLIGVFELLADAREQVGSVQQALEAQRDFWLADVALRAALVGRPLGGAAMEIKSAPAAAGAGGH